MLLLSGCGSESTTSAIDSAAPAYSNLDLSNSRKAEGPIRAATVSDLDAAWGVPIAVEGSRSGSVASPVVAGGVVYAQDTASNVQAIELETGRVLWEKTYDSPTVGPNGVLVADGFVYGATKAHAFGLDRETGEEVWSTPLLRSASERITMAPGYHDGFVYVSTVPAAFDGGEVGILWALDGETGRKVWSFDTVPKSLWGHRDLNFGGGLTHSPAFDGDGSMYVGVGNPGPIPGTKRFPWGSSRPGRNLYTDSVVKLDARTGQVQWHYQVTPHDVCNGDIGAPVLVRAGGRDLVIAGGKSGIVVALDRESGELVWRRAVGVHTGHDRIGLEAMRGDYSRLKTPMTIYPGKFGGVFAPLAVSGSAAFVPVINYGAVVLSQDKQAAAAGAITGELVALNLTSGAVRWNTSSRRPCAARRSRSTTSSSPPPPTERSTRSTPRAAASCGSRRCRRASARAWWSAATPCSPPPVTRRPAGARRGSWRTAWRPESGEGGIRTLERACAPYSLSRRVPSATRPPLRIPNRL